MLFPADYDDEFDSVFGSGALRHSGPRPVPDPTVYVSAPDDPASSGELVELAIAAAPGDRDAMTTRQASDFLRFLASGAPAGVSAGDRIEMRWRRAG